jgi:hypothetical protein
MLSHPDTRSAPAVESEEVIESVADNQRMSYACDLVEALIRRNDSVDRERVSAARYARSSMDLRSGESFWVERNRESALRWKPPHARRCVRVCVRSRVRADSIASCR